MFLIFLDTDGTCTDLEANFFQFYSHFKKTSAENALRAASAVMRSPAIQTAIRPFSRQFVGNYRQFGAKSGNSDPGDPAKTRGWRQFTNPADCLLKFYKGEQELAVPSML